MAQQRKIGQEEIVSHALQLADQDGLSAVTLGAIAKHFGIKTPSLYNHIDGMNALKRAMAIEGIERMYRAMSAIPNNNEDTLYLFQLSHAYVTFARQHPGIYEATFLEKTLQNDLFQRAASKIVGLVTQALHVYELDANNEIHTVRGLRSLLHGFVSIENKGGFGLSILPDDSLHKMIELYIKGVLHSD